MSNPDQLDHAVSALAAEVERLTRRLDQAEAEAATARETAEHAHRVLVDLVDRVADLADTTTTTNHEQGAGNPAGAPTSWLTLDDPDTAQTIMTQLVDWLGKVYIHYPGAADSLGECWPRHPAVIEELLALQAAWHAAYTSPDATAQRAIDWHDRHLPGTQRRLRATLADCSEAAHQPGGRADQSAPVVPAVEFAGKGVTM